MDPSYEDYLDEMITKRYRQLELEVMRDIVRRIKKTEKITSSADWQIMRLTIMGNSPEEIRKKITEVSEMSEGDVQKLFDDVIDKEYTRSADLYKEVGAEFIPYEQNHELQQLTQALITQSNNELKSITGTTGFMLDYGDGQGLRFTPHTQVFDEYLNNAVMGIATGTFDYNTMIRKVVTQMTNSGLRTVDYASGRHDRVDVAARRAVLTGLSQLTGRITDTNAAALNTDHFEVAWHAGARPTHQEWQGRVWSKKELVDVCGLGSVTGLLGANCYHDYYPFIPGVSERMYSDEWLDEMNKEENTPKIFNGKEYTAYEARQHQRYQERCMRAQREKVELLKEGGADKDEVMLARCKYQAQLDEYKRFSKVMKLPEQRERIYYDMKGRIAPTKKQIEKFFEEQAKKKSNKQTEADKHKERAEEARRADMANEKSRVRAYGKAPIYDRNETIDKCESSDEIKALFPQISFFKNFNKLSLDAQKEVAQGFHYMRELFGDKALPWTCGASKMDDYGETKMKQRKISIKSDIDVADAFSTACHECMHVMDYNRGLLSYRVLPSARKRLGIKDESNAMDRLVVDLLGIKLYTKYRHDDTELMAYAFEEYLFDSDNDLVMAIIEQLVGELK